MMPFHGGDKHLLLGARISEINHLVCWVEVIVWVRFRSLFPQPHYGVAIGGSILARSVTLRRKKKMEANESTPAPPDHPTVPEVRKPQKNGKGCRGWLRQGCGCFGVFGVIILVWILWPSFLPGKPQIASILPPSTLEVRYTEELEALQDRHGVNMPVGLLQPLVDAASLTGSQAQSVARIFTKEGFLVVFVTPEAGPAIERVSGLQGYTSGAFGEWKVVLSPSDSTPQNAWLALDERTLVVGAPAAVEAVLQVASEQQGDLLEERPHLKPIMHTLGNHHTFFVIVQDDEIRAQGEALGEVLEALDYMPGWFASLFSTQAFGGSRQDTTDECTFVLSTQFGDPMAAFIMTRFSNLGSIIHFFSDKSGVYVPDRRSVDRSGPLVETTSWFSRNKCDYKDKRENEQNSEYFVRW